MKSPPKTQGKKPGRKGKKVRSHVSLSENMHAIAEFLGQQTFGNKTAYIEHLLLNDLERQKLSVPEVMRLADEWREKQNAKGE